MVSKNSDKAVKKTTNKISKGADDSGTRCLNNINEIKQKKKNDLEIEFVNEMHVQDFKKALEYDPINMTPSNSTEHISAWTDALPSRSTSTPTTNKKSSSTKKSRRKLAEQEAAKPIGVSHSLMQYPLIVSH